MMKTYDEPVEINHNPNWYYIPDHPHTILIICGSGLAKTNLLLNVIKHQQNCLHFKDPFESKSQLIINRKGRVEIK